MKPYQKLALAFLAMVLCACILSPAVKPLADRVVPTSEKLSKKLDYDEDTKTYDFGKVFRRLLMVSAVVVLVIGARTLEIRSVAVLGFRRSAGWRKCLLYGVVMGLVSLGAFTVVLYLLGAALWRGSFEPAVVLGKSAKFLLQVAFIGLFEETLFRGVVLQTLMKDMRFLLAAALSSVLYSLLHFFKADVTVGMGGDLWVGFRSLGICFMPLVSDPTIIPAFLGLFLLGMVFAYAYRWTQSLYLPIALHASWVFALKLSAALFYLGVGRPEWLYGSKQIVDGVMGCVFLAVCFALLWFLFGRRPRSGDDVVGGRGPDPC